MQCIIGQRNPWKRKQAAGHLFLRSLRTACPFSSANITKHAALTWVEREARVKSPLSEGRRAASMTIGGVDVLIEGIHYSDILAGLWV